MFRIAVTIGVLYGLIRLMAYLSDVLIPFAVAFLLAYLLNPAVLWVQAKIKNRAAAVFLTLAAALACLAALLLANERHTWEIGLGIIVILAPLSMPCRCPTVVDFVT